MATTIRTFEDRDFPAFVEISRQVQPEWQSTEEETRHRYKAWDRDRYYLYHVVAEDDSDQVVGWGLIQHVPDQFHPDKYSLDVAVNPAAQRRGIGGALYDHLLEHMQARDALLVRTEAKESKAESIGFLERRGFYDVQRGWESRLDVASFDETPFAGAEERVAANSITVTTLAAEMATNPEVVRQAYQLYLVGMRDAPEVDEVTDVPFEYFIATQIDDPTAMLDGYFLAKDSGRLVAQSTLTGSEADPDVLYQDLTAVVPEYRRRGIALALKLQTVAFARERGKREIRTWNNTRNQAMLRINEAMGFVKQPVWIVFQKDLGGGARDVP